MEHYDVMMRIKHWNKIMWNACTPVCWWYLPTARPGPLDIGFFMNPVPACPRAGTVTLTSSGYILVYHRGGSVCVYPGIYQYYWQTGLGQGAWVLPRLLTKKWPAGRAGHGGVIWVLERHDTGFYRISGHQISKFTRYRVLDTRYLESRYRYRVT